MSVSAEMELEKAQGVQAGAPGEVQRERGNSEQDKDWQQAPEDTAVVGRTGSGSRDLHWTVAVVPELRGDQY